MRKLIIATTLITLTGLSAPASANDNPAKALHNENCVRCHDSKVYTRADRRVTSRDALTKQVRRCELMLGLKWFDENVESVSDYLNNDYYKFQ